MKRAAEVTENPTTSTKKAKLDNVSSVIPSSQSPTRQSSSTSSSSSSSSTVSSTLPKNVTLPMNSVIEVQWDIHDPLSSEIISSWFKASYLGINNGTSRHTIKYNAQGSFPECQCEVIFLSNSRLLDCNENDALLWRHEGKPWIADENDEEFGASLIKEQDVSGNEVTMTMQELLEDQTHMDLIEHGGNSLEGMGMNAMGQLPYMQQVRVVSGYRDFATALKAKLKSIQDSKGEGALVTEKDIQSFMADLRKK